MICYYVIFDYYVWGVTEACFQTPPHNYIKFSLLLGVCKHWIGLLEWITGLIFDLRFSRIVHVKGVTCKINSYTSYKNVIGGEPGVFKCNLVCVG